MYQIKKKVYLDLTLNQRSSLCNYLRALVKKMPQATVEEIIDKFMEDEDYYLEQGCSRFEFLEKILHNDVFLSDTKKIVAEYKKYYEYKEQQRPIIEANKEFEKKKRKFLQEVKMSKEVPTKKQLYFYDKLCQKYGIEKKELSSKLQARDEIDKIIEENKKEFNRDVD